MLHIKENLNLSSLSYLPFPQNQLCIDFWRHCPTVHRQHSSGWLHSSPETIMMLRERKKQTLFIKQPTIKALHPIGHFCARDGINGLDNNLYTEMKDETLFRFRSGDELHSKGQRPTLSSVSATDIPSLWPNV